MSGKKQKQTLIDDLQSNIVIDISNIGGCHTCIHSQSYLDNIGYCKYKNQPVTKLNFCGEHEQRTEQSELE